MQFPCEQRLLKRNAAVNLRTEQSHEHWKLSKGGGEGNGVYCVIGYGYWIGQIKTRKAVRVSGERLT